MITDAFRSMFSGMRKSAVMQHDDNGWHPLMRSRTTSGEAVSVESASGLSAVHCATRVITETIAMLPFNLRETLSDGVSTRTAIEHPLQGVIHNQPNSEQNTFTFFDTLIPQQINAGGAFAEIQRSGDLKTGPIKALWPIHNSRVKVRRGPIKGEDGHVYGIDGTIVYEVTAGNGSKYGLEQWEMLHVPGMMSGDVLTGVGLVWVAAESLGAIQATEKHVSSFFKNGASPDLVISIKSPVPPEERQNLRTSLQAKHAGAANAHKTMLLFGDTEVDQVGINPEQLMLIDMRRFGIAEVSRFWRVPMHMLSELGRATWSNMEEQGQDFVTYTLGPWIKRWELAMDAQLLNKEERKRFFFKCNVNALLRGNTAARAALYNALFGLSVVTPNMICESEDLNPFEGGDRRFLLGNNYIPYDRIDDANTIRDGSAAQPQQPGEPDADDAEDATAADARKLQDVARGLLATTIKGLMGYEARAALQQAESHKFDAWIAEFYGGKFADKFREQVTPILAGAKGVGATVNGDELTSRHVLASMAAISNCRRANLDSTMAVFVADLKSLFDNWTHRAEAEANAAFGITKDQP